MSVEHIETLIIGAGQAGLATARNLQLTGRDCLVVDANERVGDGWRRQWDTLKLYSPAKYDGLPGLPFPGKAWSFPGKDEVADYFETYAQHFDLPVRLNTESTAWRPMATGTSPPAARTRSWPTTSSWPPGRSDGLRSSPTSQTSSTR